jgi:hypothetical protein
MMRLLVALLIACAWLGADATPSQVADPATEKERRDSGLIEETRRRLVQLDVSLTGPPELTADLQAEDFRLVVGGKAIQDFHVDRVCGGQPRPARRGSPVTRCACCATTKS